jgi:hypothetical protein
MRVSVDPFIRPANSKRIGVFNDRALEDYNRAGDWARGNMAEMNMTHLLSQESGASIAAGS